MTSDLTSAIFITLVSMCLMTSKASEAMVASKRPWRSHLTSKFISVTSITYVPMSLWSLTVTIHNISAHYITIYKIFQESKPPLVKGYHPLTCVASPQVKITGKRADVVTTDFLGQISCCWYRHISEVRQRGRGRGNIYIRGTKSKRGSSLHHLLALCIPHSYLWCSHHPRGDLCPDC